MRRYVLAIVAALKNSEVGLINIGVGIQHRVEARGCDLRNAGGGSGKAAGQEQNHSHPQQLARTAPPDSKREDRWTCTAEGLCVSKYQKRRSSLPPKPDEPHIAVASNGDQVSSPSGRSEVTFQWGLTESSAIPILPSYRDAVITRTNCLAA